MNLKNKKILVTGGAGFLGKHIVQSLREHAVPAKNITVPRSADIDLRDPENCKKAVQGIDVVIHAAGSTGGIEFHKKNPGAIFYDNLMIGVELMEAARKAGVQKFVTIGSAMEYPDTTELPFREENIWQGLPEKIHVPYAVAKKSLLVQAQAYRKQYGCNAVHLLLTNMYGPGEVADFVIPMLVKRVGEAKKLDADHIEMWGTGKPTRDFIYVEDAAEGIVTATEKYEKSDPVNIASGWEISIRELAEMVSRLMDFKGRITWNTEKPDGQMRRMLDTTRAEREFGFKAFTDFETGLKKTIEYHGY